MRTKKVNRYWCDFCSRAGLQAGAMAKHEKHCTMNPARSCRVCAIMHGSQSPSPERLREFVAILPPYMDFESDGWGNTTQRYIDFCAAVNAAVPALREAADSCPACMMAALRQAKIPVPMADGFDFKTEMRVVLDDYNQQKNDEGYY